MLKFLINPKFSNYLKKKQKKDRFKLINYYKLDNLSIIESLVLSKEYGSF